MCSLLLPPAAALLRSENKFSTLNVEQREQMWRLFANENIEFSFNDHQSLCKGLMGQRLDVNVQIGLVQFQNCKYKTLLVCQEGSYLLTKFNRGLTLGSVSGPVTFKKSFSLKLDCKLCKISAVQSCIMALYNLVTSMGTSMPDFIWRFFSDSIGCAVYCSHLFCYPSFYTGKKLSVVFFYGLTLYPRSDPCSYPFDSGTKLLLWHLFTLRPNRVNLAITQDISAVLFSFYT